MAEVALAISIHYYEVAIRDHSTNLKAIKHKLCYLYLEWIVNFTSILKLCVEMRILLNFIVVVDTFRY